MLFDNSSWTGAAASHSNTRYRWLYLCCRRRIYASVNWVIIQSDNGLSPVRHQAIIWTNAASLLIEPFETKFSQILIAIHGRKQGPGGDSSSKALVENRQFFFTKHVKFTSFSLNDRSLFPVKICTYATLLSYTISTFVDIKAITCDNACHGHYGTRAWPRSMHEPSTHCDYSGMKRRSPAVRASRIYSNQALTPSWRRLTTENWNIFIQENGFENVVCKMIT